MVERTGVGLGDVALGGRCGGVGRIVVADGVEGFGCLEHLRLRVRINIMWVEG